MSKHWQPYAHHILDAAKKIHLIQERGDIQKDEILYDATLRNLRKRSVNTTFRQV